MYLDINSKFIHELHVDLNIEMTLEEETLAFTVKNENKMTLLKSVHQISLFFIIIIIYRILVRLVSKKECLM